MNQSVSELTHLIRNRLSSILSTECGNNLHVYLYHAGNYWVAFERSAYNLCRAFDKAIITPMKIVTFPFPIVMASIEDKDMTTVAKTLQCEKRTPHERTYQSRPSQATAFQKWHTRQVKHILPLPSRHQ